MRLGFIALAIAGIGPALLATPALADTPTDMGARAELRSGVIWPDGQAAKGEIGAAIGYDVGVGSSGAFVGIEESVDKVLASNRNTRFATQARVGFHVSPADKLYATGGYRYGEGPDGATVGAGWEHGFGGRAYTKVEYKRFLNETGSNSNAALVGVGMHF